MENRLIQTLNPKLVDVYLPVSRGAALSIATAKNSAANYRSRGATPRHTPPSPAVS